MGWQVCVLMCAGQFTCGNKKCQESEGLRSWEVNFAYMEHGEKKNALVKLSKLFAVVLFVFLVLQTFWCSLSVV